MRVAHPLIPYITETLWREARDGIGTFRQDDHARTVSARPATSPMTPKRVAAIEWLKAVVVGIRNIRGEMGIASGVGVDLLFQDGGAIDRERLRETETLLRRMAGVESVSHGWIRTPRRRPRPCRSSANSRCSCPSQD